MNNEPKITPRELQIIKLLCAEIPNKTIGKELQITERTVQTILANIRKKIGCQTSVGVAVYALKNKLVL